MIKVDSNVDFSKYGLLPSPKDERDYNYENIVSFPSEPLPKKFKLDTLSVRRQGLVGSCVGFAGSALQECDEMVKGNFNQLSPLYLYAKCKEIDGLKVEGTNLRVCMKVLKDLGICRENLYPYQDNEDIKKLNFPFIGENLNVDARDRKVSGYAKIKTKYAVKNAIFNENGALASVLITDNFEFPQKGVVGDIEGFVKGYHAILLCGWDDEKIVEFRYSDGVVKKYKGVFIFKNSWGKEWGDNGFGYIPYDLFDIESNKQPPFEFKLVDEVWTTFHISAEKENKNYHKNKEWNTNGGNVISSQDYISIEMSLGDKNVLVRYPDGSKELKKGLVAPTVIKGSTLVPFRLPFEVIGDVEWDQDTKTAKVKITKEKLEDLLKKF